MIPDLICVVDDFTGRLTYGHLDIYGPWEFYSALRSKRKVPFSRLCEYAEITDIKSDGFVWINTIESIKGMDGYRIEFSGDGTGSVWRVL